MLENNCLTETHHVPSLDTPARLPDYAIGIFLNAPTKSALKKAIKKGQITVDGLPASTATWIKGGETIMLELIAKTDPHKPLIFPLQVLYEDEYLAAVHKPAGILVSGNSFKTMARALPQNLERSRQPDATLPQPVHRLDYATTGILLVGKTMSSIRTLNQLFEAKQVQKTYYAITIGSQAKHGVLDTPVDGKPAQSSFTVLQAVPSPRFGTLNLVRLQPQTGRRHQLRQHLAAIGHPILGDKDYGREPLILKGKGMYLHAYSLSFNHPFTGEELLLKDDKIQRFQKIFPDLVA